MKPSKKKMGRQDAIDRVTEMLAILKIECDYLWFEGSDWMYRIRMKKAIKKGETLLRKLSAGEIDAHRPL